MNLKHLLSLVAAAALTHTAMAHAKAPNHKPLLLAHYMPWFVADAQNHKWGWHWTMNHFDPGKTQNGLPEIASHYHPLIGVYDSDDPAVITYEVMLMKMSGIDGVLIDWYGNDNYLDYADNQRRTLDVIREVKRAGLKYAIVYEDQTVPRLISGGKFTQDQAETHINAMFKWMDGAWFHDPSYLKLNGKPVLLVFGPQYFKDAQWSTLFKGVSPQPAFFTLMQPKGPAVGAFDWPMPHGGDSGSATSVDDFYSRSKAWPVSIPAAFPQFDDIYKEAGVGPSYGHISGDGTQLYEQLLLRGIRSGQPYVQLVTWNDWGEGTMIEPSVEGSYRYLEATQRVYKRLIDPSSPWSLADIKLALEWYQQHKLPGMQRIPSLIYSNHPTQAKKAMQRIIGSR